MEVFCMTDQSNKLTSKQSEMPKTLSTLRINTFWDQHMLGQMIT